MQQPKPWKEIKNEVNKRLLELIQDPNQRALLNQFLGTKFDALRHLPNPLVPPGLKKETLEEYLRMARAASASPDGDPAGVQALRVTVIERALSGWPKPQGSA
jgi:hypothetical protein